MTTKTVPLYVTSVRQVDGGTRLLAISEDDHRMLRRDSTLIDCLKPAAIMDIERGGSAAWQWCGDGYGSDAGRKAIRAYRARLRAECE